MGRMLLPNFIFQCVNVRVQCILFFACNDIIYGQEDASSVRFPRSVQSQTQEQIRNRDMMWRWLCCARHLDDAPNDKYRQKSPKNNFDGIYMLSPLCDLCFLDDKFRLLY